jgi:CcmD family protein
MSIRAVLIALVLLVAAPLHAQTQPPSPATPPAGTQPATPAAQDGFVPVDSPISPDDVMPAPRLVAIAYALVWVIFFAYVWSVRTRLVRVERELHSVSRRVGGAKKE